MSNDLGDKIDNLAEVVGKMDKKLDVHMSDSKKDIESHDRDIDEMRETLWDKKDGLAYQVKNHGYDIAFGKWVVAIIGGATLLALANSILHLVVK